MGREDVNRWLHEHRLLPAGVWHLAQVVDFLKAQWVLLMLLALGFMAFVTAVLLAWPALAFLAAKLFS